MTSLEIKYLNDLSSLENGCAVAVGSFDGLHRGHTALINELVAEASKLGLPAVVVTFSECDNPKGNSRLLAQPAKKLALLKEAGVSAVAYSNFSELRSVSAYDFTTEILFKTLGAKVIVCGYDFRFGKDRLGDVKLIDELLSPKGVKVITPIAVVSDGEPISSTAIRSLIKNGNVDKANDLLGRNYSFVAEIRHGKALGRKMGFPTVNQNFPQSLVPPEYGVYAVKITLEGVTYGGVANFGVKPTFGGEGTPVCETFIFDYSGDCYGKTAEVEFCGFIRSEQCFASPSELATQVEADKSAALKILSKGAQFK